MNKLDINKRIVDRSNCFYWQTDRKISAEETKEIWLDRHSAISNEELLIKINKLLSDVKMKEIYPFDIHAQTSLGNINSIRVGRLTNGEEVIIRCHPKGIKNGYFHVESLAAQIAMQNGLPTYKTYLIHDLENEDDVAFQVISKVSGNTITYYLNNNPQDEEKMVFEMGKTMAKLHSIKVDGFGPFDNEEAKREKLIGKHKTLKDAVISGLDENLNRLVENNVINNYIAEKISKLFDDTDLLDDKEAILVHNDFADWNLLTNGNEIVGILDWDECVGGSPIEEIACWSAFFAPERLNVFLKGYFSEVPKYDNFEEKLNLYRLRYIISKMALRVKTFTYDQSDFVKQLIENGTKHLDELIEIFQLSESNNKRPS